MKRFVMAITLSCALAGSSLAGEVPSGGFTAPSPPETTSTAPGEIPSTDLKQPVTDAVLTLVQLMLGAVV